MKDERNRCFDCDSCDERKQKERNCAGESKKIFFIIKEMPQTKVNRCPRAYIQDEVSDYCKFLFDLFVEWKRYKRFHFPGGLNHQPAWLINGFNIIMDAIGTYESLKINKRARPDEGVSNG